jgi:hypothetical protein
VVHPIGYAIAAMTLNLETRGWLTAKDLFRGCRGVIAQTADSHMDSAMPRQTMEALQFFDNVLEIIVAELDAQQRRIMAGHRARSSPYDAFGCLRVNVNRNLPLEPAQAELNYIILHLLIA